MSCNKLLKLVCGWCDEIRFKSKDKFKLRVPADPGVVEGTSRNKWHRCWWHKYELVVSLSFDSTSHHVVVYPICGLVECVGTESSCMKDNLKQAPHLLRVAGAPNATVRQGNKILVGYNSRLN